MQLTKDAIEEFKNLYLQEFKVALSNKEAMDYGTKLIRLVNAVYGRNLPKLKNVDTEKN